MAAGRAGLGRGMGSSGPARAWGLCAASGSVDLMRGVNVWCGRVVDRRPAAEAEQMLDTVVLSTRPHVRHATGTMILRNISINEDTLCILEQLPEIW